MTAHGPLFVDYTPINPAKPDKEPHMDSKFFADAAERAIKTFAQTLLAYFGASALDVLNADWGNALSVAAGAVVLSVLTSLLSIKFGNSGTASLTTAVEPSGLLPSQRTPGPDHAA